MTCDICTEWSVLSGTVTNSSYKATKQQVPLASPPFLHVCPSPLSFISLSLPPSFPPSLPPSLPLSLSHPLPPSSILCISYVALAMLIRMSLSWANYDLTSNGTETSNSSSSLIPEDHKVAVRPPAFKGILTTISYCSLAFVCHFNLLPLQKELQRPTKTRLNIIVISSMVIAYLIYNVVIFSGYFTVSYAREDAHILYTCTCTCTTVHVDGREGE